MGLWQFIKKINARQFWSLFKLCISHIWFVWPTLKATQRTVALANTHFGSRHHKNTRANAFRHALWNFLIAKECSGWNKKEDTVISWTKHITEIHEMALPGNVLANAMDIHNNEVGQYVFLQNKEIALEKTLALLLEMTRNSKKISTLDELVIVPKDQMVHLIDV